MSTTELPPDVPVVLTEEDRVAFITLNRPERMNALAGGMRDDLYAALDRAGSLRGIRVIVITGTGRGFCTGADLQPLAEMVSRGDEEAFARNVDAGKRVVRKIVSLRQPVIAALNGPAAGAGAALALACDVRIASERAAIGFTFTRIGLGPDWGTAFFLPRMVGLARATELIFSGRMIDAEEAQQLGIFQRVVPDTLFEEMTAAYAHELAEKPPLALALAKRTLSRTFESNLTDVLGDEAEAQMQCFRSDDVREGIAAFVEKRRPHFRGE